MAQPRTRNPTIWLTPQLEEAGLQITVAQCNHQLSDQSIPLAQRQRNKCNLVYLLNKFVTVFRNNQRLQQKIEQIRGNRIANAQRTAALHIGNNVLAWRKRKEKRDRYLNQMISCSVQARARKKDNSGSRDAESIKEFNNTEYARKDRPAKLEFPRKDLVGVQPGVFYGQGTSVFIAWAKKVKYDHTTDCYAHRDCPGLPTGATESRPLAPVKSAFYAVNLGLIPSQSAHPLTLQHTTESGAQGWATQLNSYSTMQL